MAAVGETHHVRIGNDHHLIRLGSYRRRGAPLFGARFSSGDPDYNDLTLWQYWAQTCWIGGMGAPTWLDDAMFDEGVGVDTSQHEVAVLTRDLGPNGAFERSNDKWEMGGHASKREFVSFNGKLYCLCYDNSGVAQLFRFNNSTDDWTSVRTWTSQTVLSVVKFDRKLYFGDSDASLTYMNPDETFGTVAKPSGITAIPRAMGAFRERLYVGFDNEIWRLKPNQDWDGSTAFYEAVGIDELTHMELHLGFLYMSSANGHILRTDGNNTFDMWSFDTGEISGLRSYDGRLFVALNVPIVGTTASEGVLYQFTGAAVTELKRWGREGEDCTLGKLRVIGSRLFYGASDLLGIGGGGFGIAVYDAVEDAHSLWSTNRDVATYVPGTDSINYQVHDVFYWRGYVYCSVFGYGVFRAALTYRDFSRYLATYDTSAAGAGEGSQNGGWLASSDFDAGTPGLMKLWDSITIHVDLPVDACSVYVEYSTDGGETWAHAGTVNKDPALTRHSVTVPLRDAVTDLPVRGTRLKWRLTLRTTDNTRTPALRGVIVRYLPQPEPTWEWDFSIVLSERQELLDGTTEDLDDVTLEAKRQAIFDAYRDQTPIEFRDIDWADPDPAFRVLILHCEESVVYKGPHSDGAVESDVRLRLIEIDDDVEVTP